MLNAEKFKDKIIEEYQNLLKKAVIDGDGNRMNKAIKTIAYKHCGKQLCGASSTFKWLCEEYKEPVKLTRFEHEVLKHLLNDTEYRYIVRNKYRHEGGVFNLYIFKDKPFKDSGVWYSGRDSVSEFYVFNNLFAFVRWEDSEPTPIKEVLENCEVVDDD